jgi:hypothetical protein
MLIQEKTSFNPIQSKLFRDFAIPQDRVPRNQRIDLPEIQESFRVSFSEGALAASSEGSRNVMQKARPTDEGSAAELKLRSYMAIAAL